MWNRLLVAVDDLESGQRAVDYSIGLATRTGAALFVLHIRELPVHPRALPLETPADAQDVVAEAVCTARRAGVQADGRSCSVATPHIAARIGAEAAVCGCDAIVLGSRRLRGLGRLAGRGVRERVIRLSHLPVLVAPAPLSDGLHTRVRLQAHA